MFWFLILCFELEFICDCRGIVFWVEGYALFKNVVMLLPLNSYVVGELCFGLKVMHFLKCCYVIKFVCVDIDDYTHRYDKTQQCY